MINKNSSSCNRAISFESLFTYIGVRSLLAKAKFSKRSGADVFTLLSVLVTSIFKGYPNLYRFFASTEGRLGWTDGVNYVPVLSHLIASNKEKNLIQKANTGNIDNRTTGARRRLLACKKKPGVLISMCTRTMRAIPATYILMDSWFFSDFLVRKLKQLGLQSICLVKSNLQFKLGKGSSKVFSQKDILKEIKALVKKVGNINNSPYFLHD